MTPTVDIILTAGDSLGVTINVKKPDGKVDPLIGATATWYVKKVAYAQQYDLEKPVTVSDPANGVLKLQIDPQDTRNLLGIYNYKVVVLDALQNISTVLKGKLTIE